MKPEKAFIKAYDDYADAIYRYSYLRTSSKEQAEDVTQETFVKTWRYLAEGNVVENIRALLYKIATNVIIDQSRKKKEERLDLLLEDKKIPEPSHEGHKDMERMTLLHEVREVIDELGDEDKEMIIWRYWDDLDPKEIAEITGLTPNHVSVKIHRAMKSLQKLLEK